MFGLKILITLSISGVLILAYGKPREEYHKITGRAQGSTYAITFHGKKAQLTKTQADSIFQVIDRSMSLWDKNSTLSKFNRSTHKQEIDEHFQVVFQKSLQIYQLSTGAFDPTVSPLIKAYGFIQKNDFTLASAQKIDSLKQFIGFDKVKLTGSEVSKKEASVQLDFNAIAQGYTVDVLAQFLENKGIINYLIEVGGEVRAKGTNSRGDFWRIGIEKPFVNETNDLNDIQMILSLKNLSLATSGNYRNYIQSNNKRIGHIIDPKTGRPVEHKVVAVSVLAPICTEADAWATAFTVLGKEKSIELSKKMGYDIQIVSANGTELEVFQTDGFKKQIQKENNL